MISLQPGLLKSCCGTEIIWGILQIGPITCSAGTYLCGMCGAIREHSYVNFRAYWRPKRVLIQNEVQPLRGFRFNLDLPYRLYVKLYDEFSWYGRQRGGRIKLWSLLRLLK